ncbi:YebC/PmpR family DNA-binding transcriptional regulator [Patescibacteria group bacterium]|nr:YebC/PmpR family DNA-binding transcriptional regulator [Patescibacteria group bacterium]
MSGHSHYSSIKYKKEISDKKRGQVFSKISRLISIAVKEGGSDPGVNPKLRLAIEQAKKANMPKDNIERATQRGVGAIGKEQLEQVVFEAYGPGGIAIIVEGITDNKNRTLGEIRQILTQHNGKLAGGGSVKWLFERKGAIIVNNEEKTIDKEDLELTAIEAGAEDIYWHDDILDVYTKPEELEKVKKNLEEKEIKIDSASLDWVAKEMIEVEEKEKQACQKLFEALDENDAVQDIYSNLKL